MKIPKFTKNRGLLPILIFSLKAQTNRGYTNGRKKMAVTHTAATRNALANLVNSRINDGSGISKIYFLDINDTVLAILNLPKPAFADAIAGTLVLLGVPLYSDDAVEEGVTTKFVVYNGDNREEFGGTVTKAGEGGDIELADTTVQIDDTITIVNMTYSASL